MGYLISRKCNIILSIIFLIILKSSDFSNNNFENLEVGLFDDIPNLLVLYFSTVFIYVTDFLKRDLSLNKLTNIQNGVFNKLSTLFSLYNYLFP